MKKFVTAIVAFLYLGITSGVVVNLHYCMNKLASVNLLVSETNVCGKCGMKKQGDCCKDEVKVVKVNDEHKYVPVSFVFGWESLPPETNIAAVIGYPIRAAVAENRAHGPPLTAGCPLYIRNCVFRV